VSKYELLAALPKRRVKPIDGMAVTAEVWEEAHEFHRHALRAHLGLNHGAGIVIGLDVIASDPPDNAVYVQPGVALDALGNTIAVPQAFSYELGAAQGPLYLLLTYGESQPHSEDQRDDGVMYIPAQFSLAAAASAAGGVELARLNRQARSAPIVNARDSAQPGANEIDLRYRQWVGAVQPKLITLGVGYLGGAQDRRHGRGALVLARAISRSQPLRVVVDDNVVLRSELSRYTLLYLVGHGAFQLPPEEMNTIYAYLQAGGMVLYESCRQDADAAKADAIFLDLLSSLGQKIDDLPRLHALLNEPHFFAQPPAGYEPNAPGSIRLSRNVIFSSSDYGCVWQGERRSGPADRADIRSALEFGENVVTYAVRSVTLPDA
jgi:hypothetical protein